MILKNTAGLCAPALLTAVLIGSLLAAAAGNDSDPDTVAPWKTSRVSGSPEPPPKYRSTRLFPNVRFESPVAIAMAPGDPRWWVAEQRGKLFVVAPKTPGGEKHLVIDLKEALARRDQSSGPRIVDYLYGIAFPPDFETSRQVVLSYTVITGKENEHLPDGTRISRFRVTPGDPPQFDAESEEILLTFLEGGHNGSCIQFGPDGALYISTGDADGPSPPDPKMTGQDNTDFLSSVLRIDVRTPSEGRLYTIPADNPFLGVPNVRPEIWAYGFRNPWKMSFDRQTGDLWLGDVGWELWELIHKVERGGNYGWSIVEGRQPVHPEVDPGPSPVSPPVIELPHTMAASITGGFVYRGSRFPELQGSYVFGDWETKRIWAWPTSSKAVRDAATELVDLIEPSVRIIAFGEDHDGELCLLDYDAGTLHGFEPNPEAGVRTAFPTRLSETGLFESVSRHEPAEGVIRLTPNAAQWCDGATANRLLGLPDGQSVVWYPNSTPIPGSMFSRHLEFPTNSVLAKTLTLPGPQPRRVETQLLHYDGRTWRGYSYRWNPGGTDAELVPAEGDEAVYEVADPISAEGHKSIRWTFASRTQCMVCHNSWAEYTLVFNPLQLSRPAGGESSRGPTWNQLLRQGVVRQKGADGRFVEPPPAETVHAPAVVDPHDESQPLNARARSYLHANCSHCHQFGGGGGVQIDLRLLAEDEPMKVFNVAPVQGTFGLEDPRIIVPGDPFRSVLFLRMAKCGRGRMPHLASEQPHEAGLRLIQSWIESLSPEAPSASGRAVDQLLGAAEDAGDREIQRGLIQKCLSPGSSALAAARWLDERPAPPPVAREIVELVSASTDSITRDLFARHLPEAPADRVGSLPRPRLILPLEGDPESGRALFWKSETLNCKTCHRVGPDGGQVGPDLAGIAIRRPRVELLESLLDPSRDVDPKFASYAAQTTDGRTFAGLLVSRTPETVELRDAKGALIALPAVEIETLKVQRASIMPEGLLKDLTLQQAADLLAYLETLR